MITDFLLLAVGLLGLVFAVVVDIRTKEIPDWLTYGLLIAGLGIRLIHSLVFFTWGYFLYALLSTALMFLIGVGFYYAKQWGGGDAKLIAGLGAVFATRPSFVADNGWPFAIALLVNILILGALYGLIYSIVLAVRYRKRFVKELKFLNRQRGAWKMKIVALLISLASFVMVLFVVDDLRMKIASNSLVVFILVFPYIKIFVKAIENSCLYQIKAVKDLAEGDWVEQDVIIRGKVIYRKKPLGIEKIDIQRLKDAKVKQILVKEGIPFAPPFLIGTIVTLIIGKIMLLS